MLSISSFLPSFVALQFRRRASLILYPNFKCTHILWRSVYFTHWNILFENRLSTFGFQVNFFVFVCVLSLRFITLSTMPSSYTNKFQEKKLRISCVCMWYFRLHPWFQCYICSLYNCKFAANTEKLAFFETPILAKKECVQFTNKLS